MYWEVNVEIEKVDDVKEGVCKRTRKNISTRIGTFLLRIMRV